jgi:hypothetical protein
MKTSFQLKALAFFVCAFLVSSMAFAQMKNMGKDGKPIPSPRDTVSGTVAGSTITIAYGSPAVKGRPIFGDSTTLQPYGKVWRAGANQMTIFQTSKDIMVEGKTLPAGTYSLFATPGEKKWNIIFNSVTGQWGIKRDGSANDDPSKDVLVVTVNAKKSGDITERLTYKIDDKGFALVWEHVTVPVRIK